MRQRTRVEIAESPDSGPLLSSSWSESGQPQGLRGLECLRDPSQHHRPGLGSSLTPGRAHSSSGYIYHPILPISFLGSCSFSTGSSLPFSPVPRPMLTSSCSLSEGGGSSQDRARKDHSLNQLDQVLHDIDKGPSSLSSDSEIRFSLFCQNLITPLSVLTIPLSIHSFVPLVIHQQVFIEHRHYSRHWDAASNMKGRIQALIELTLEKGRQKMSIEQINELEDLRVISAPKKTTKTVK